MLLPRPAHTIIIATLVLPTQQALSTTQLVPQTAITAQVAVMDLHTTDLLALTSSYQVNWILGLHHIHPRSFTIFITVTVVVDKDST